MDDFGDWEVLQHSDASTTVGAVNSSSDPATAELFGEELGGVVATSHSVIQPEYFSPESQSKPSATALLSQPDSTEAGSEASDNPSWIDPTSPVATSYPPRRNSGGELWFDSGSDRSDSRKLSDDGGGDLDKLQVHGGCGGLAELFLVDDDEWKSNAFVKDWSDAGKAFNPLRRYSTKELGFTATEEYGQGSTAAKGKIWSDSGGLPEKVWESDEAKEEVDDCQSGAELETSNDDGKKNNGQIGREMNSKDKDEKGKTPMVWWKVPFELVRYYVLKVSPVWTVSMAAAVLGFVILGRRLYRMKRKTQGLELKVTVDDNKISQFMSKAARLNEAFTVVRRVPVIRPSLPGPASTGVVTWPFVSIR